MDASGTSNKPGIWIAPALIKGRYLLLSAPTTVRSLFGGFDAFLVGYFLIKKSS